MLISVIDSHFFAFEKYIPVEVNETFKDHTNDYAFVTYCYDNVAEVHCSGGFRGGAHGAWAPPFCEIFAKNLLEND